MSSGQESDINTALAVAELDKLLKPKHVIGKDHVFQEGRRWPGEGRKADVMQQEIGADLMLLFDDDPQNVNDCVTSRLCVGILLPDRYPGLKASMLKHYTTLSNGAAGWQLLTEQII